MMHLSSRRGDSLFLELEEIALKKETNSALAVEVNRLNPPLLNLPVKKEKLWRPYFLSGFAMVALAALLIIPFYPENSKPIDILRTKGSFSSWIYVKRSENISLWKEGMSLNNGDRIQIEVLSPDSGVVLWSIKSRDGRLITKPDFMKANAVEIHAGEKKTFDKSIVLNEENDGEVLTVHFCREKITAALELLGSDKCMATSYVLRK
jgi:hypothetical protein